MSQFFKSGSLFDTANSHEGYHHKGEIYTLLLQCSLSSTSTDTQADPKYDLVLITELFSYGYCVWSVNFQNCKSLG
jgi:hypothetical protein